VPLINDSLSKTAMRKSNSPTDTLAREGVSPKRQIDTKNQPRRPASFHRRGAKREQDRKGFSNSNASSSKLVIRDAGGGAKRLDASLHDTERADSFRNSCNSASVVSPPHESLHRDQVLPVLPNVPLIFPLHTPLECIGLRSCIAALLASLYSPYTYNILK
jgi:hypothetical protein